MRPKSIRQRKVSQEKQNRAEKQELPLKKTTVNNDCRRVELYFILFFTSLYFTLRRRMNRNSFEPFRRVSLIATNITEIAFHFFV